MLLPCTSDPVAQVLVRLLLLLPYLLYAFPPCSDSPLTFFFFHVLLMTIFISLSLALL